MFLTQDDLKILTGYESPARQRKWLDSHGWIYEISRNGRVVVLRSYVESKLSDVAKKPAPVMNLDWMKKSA